ncbi:MAG: hypothetical protein N4A32_05180, partial [Marinifilaceae bacterium]|nr:hypothetical protein [Marinifilaceae bacterium]
AAINILKNSNKPKRLILLIFNLLTTVKRLTFQSVYLSIANAKVVQIFLSPNFSRKKMNFFYGH